MAWYPEPPCTSRACKFALVQPSEFEDENGITSPNTNKFEAKNNSIGFK